MEKSKSLFLKKPAILLVEILGGKRTVSEIWKNADYLSFAWLEKSVIKLENLGLIKRKKISKEKVIELTEDGKELALLFKKILKLRYKK